MAGRHALETYGTIQTVTLGADGTIDFTSIPQTFSDLYIACVARSPRAVNGANVRIAFNGDTTSANYDGQWLRGLAGAASAAESLASAAARNVGVIATANSPDASHFGQVDIFVDHYTSGVYKVVAGMSSGWFKRTTGGLFVQQNMVGWASTAAITQITLTDEDGNLTAGSQAVLYGRG